MRFVTVAGPPSVGKTAVLMHALRLVLKEGVRVAVAKIDCLQTPDGERYSRLGVPVLTGLSQDICPDHFYAANLEEIHKWACGHQAELTVLETAGLCHRCAPAMDGCLAVAVVDLLSGIDVPQKVGPVLSTADVVVMTKGDVVSQAEREVFRHRVSQVNPQAEILEVNGLTGHGALALKDLLLSAKRIEQVTGQTLRGALPSAICSYCTGEREIGASFQVGHVTKIEVEDRDGA
jgi:Ni2+-binding GTPase involved in maturation of urease and hydrogenase